jgi:RNA polymerase sigma factor (sigma-70 family)
MNAMMNMLTIEGMAWEGVRSAGMAESEAFARQLELQLDRAYRLAGLVLGNAAEAEDAVGDALERAWARRAQLRDSDRLQAWLDRIVVNACRDRIRRRSRVRLLRFEPTFDPVSERDPFGAFFEQDELLRSVGGLAIEERAVVVLHYWADLTLDEVADRLGWRLGTVKSRLHRALVHLRSAVSEGPDEVRR